MEVGPFNYELMAQCEQCHDITTVEILILNKAVTADRIWLKHSCGGRMRIIEAHEATGDNTVVSTMQNGRGRYVRG